MRAALFATISFTLYNTLLFALPRTDRQDPKPTQDPPARPAQPIEDERERLMKMWGIDIPQPREVLKAAEQFLELDVAKQDEKEAASLATRCNKAANFIGFILTEYDTYERESYRYDFVVKAVHTSSLPMRTLHDSLLQGRNMLYLLVAKKQLVAGNTSSAFFTFRDAHRLSFFEGKGVRYEAEQQMKTLMGISDLASYETFKK